MVCTVCTVGLGACTYCTGAPVVDCTYCAYGLLVAEVTVVDATDGFPHAGGPWSTVVA
jgi:hypothetical protein